MGLYWTTIFYSDIRDMNSKIVLETMDPIIDDGDKRQNFVSKSDLLRLFSHKIREEDITEHSWLVEHMYSTYDEDAPGNTETCRLQVR